MYITSKMKSEYLQWKKAVFPSKSPTGRWKSTQNVVIVITITENNYLSFIKIMSKNKIIYKK